MACATGQSRINEIQSFLKALHGGMAACHAYGMFAQAWAYGCMVAWAYGVGFIQDNNSYAWVQWAKMTWVKPSSLHGIIYGSSKRIEGF